VIASGVPENAESQHRFLSPPSSLSKRIDFSSFPLSHPAGGNTFPPFFYPFVANAAERGNQPYTAL